MRRRLERKFLKNLQNGQREAYEVVIHKHYKAIYRLLVYLTGNPDIAVDLTQETFTSAWANIDSYNSKSALGTWLHRIAYNKFIDSQRKFKKDIDLKNSLANELCNTLVVNSPVYDLICREDSQLLYDTLLKLNTKEYLVIVLHYIQGLSFREMTEMLDEPSGTIKWRTSRALQKLREYLNNEV